MPWNTYIEITKITKAPPLFNYHTNENPLLSDSAYKCYGATACLFSPPPADPNVGRSGEPRIKDVDAADSVRSLDRFLERGVVVEPQALPEPVDRINDHYSTGRVLYDARVFDFV